VVGLCRDLLGVYSTPQSPSWIRGKENVGERRGGDGGKWEGSNLEIVPRLFILAYNN